MDVAYLAKELLPCSSTEVALKIRLLPLSVGLVEAGPRIATSHLCKVSFGGHLEG